jgi:spermidine synthase
MDPILIRLFLVSMLALFCEMLVIRWLATEIRVFAYFKNLPLMAAFLGLGLGLLWTDKKLDLMKWSSASLLCFSGLMILAHRLGLTHLTIFDASKIMLFGNFGVAGVSEFKLVQNLSIMAAIFVLTTSIFVGLGQSIGRLFDKLRPLQAYSINTAGALVGIILFSTVSYLDLGPGVWLIIAGILYLLIERRALPLLIVVLGIIYSGYLATYTGKLAFGHDYLTTIWSPYYRIDLSKLPETVPIARGYEITVNYDHFQRMIDCSPGGLTQLSEAERKAWLEFYELPFRIAHKENPSVLILGAGNGNDVAAALRCGARHIDAVELDRCIYNLGKQFHTERPYDSPKVATHITDARTFLKNCLDKYDVILYAALDSHTAFSALSSLRTDNYIFTVESFRQAVRLLKPDGYMVVSFFWEPPWLFNRHYKDLCLATNTKPLGYRRFNPYRKEFGLLLSGTSIHDEPCTNIGLQPVVASVYFPIPEATDDWPFLFLPQRNIPTAYMQLLLVVLFLAILPLRRLIAAGSATTVNWQMFLLGMGFMLLEVRTISAMSLLCGSTWTVNSFVIGGVMVAILFANFLAARLPSSSIVILVTTTIAAILLSTMVGVSNLNSFGTECGTIIGTAIYLLPMLFSATAFSVLFKHSPSTSQALAFNVIGGTLGVIVEYASMIYGIKALAWFAIAIYVGVLLLRSTQVASK